MNNYLIIILRDPSVATRTIGANAYATNLQSHQQPLAPNITQHIISTNYNRDKRKGGLI